MLEVGELCSVRKGKGVEEGIYILIYMAVATGTAIRPWPYHIFTR